jgi:hypothetical protein
MQQDPIIIWELVQLFTLVIVATPFNTINLGL